MNLATFIIASLIVIYVLWLIVPHKHKPKLTGCSGCSGSCSGGCSCNTQHSQERPH